MNKDTTLTSEVAQVLNILLMNEIKKVQTANVTGYWVAEIIRLDIDPRPSNKQ